MRVDDMEYRFVEFRAENDAITGVVLPYGRATRIGDFTEEFRSGAFGKIEDVILNLQHQRAKPVARTGAGLVLDDKPTELRAAVTLPDTTYGREARELVEGNILRGFSIEFRAQDDEWHGTHRIVKAARLFGIALVDRPAYSDAEISHRWARDAEARQDQADLKYYF